MEAETTVSGIGHQKENIKHLICEETAVDKFPETLLELRSSVTKQNPDEKIESPKPNGSDSFGFVNAAKDTKGNTSLEDVKVEASEKFMEAQALMGTAVQTEGEKRHFEGEEFGETPSETKVVSVISSDEYGPAETLDRNLEETKEQETNAATLATRQNLMMQIQIQKNKKECGEENSEILADEFPQNAQAQSGDLSGLLIKEKSAARALFMTAEDDNLMKSFEMMYSKQSESENRKKEDQKEAEQENVSSISFQQNSTIPIGLPDSLTKGDESNFFESVEAIHEIGQENSEDEKPKDVGFFRPGKIAGDIPVGEHHFRNEISSISENSTPEKHDDEENMDSGDSTFSKNLTLVMQEKCEPDEANKESVPILNRQSPEDTISVADEWIENATRELKEQIIETLEDGLDEKKSIGTEYTNICESPSEEGNVEHINQGNAITKETQLSKETMKEKLKTPSYTRNKEETNPLDAKGGKYSEESHCLSSESSECKDINNLENVTDDKSLLPSEQGANKETLKSEEVCETHSPSMISSTKELPLKEGEIQETGAEICDSAAKQLKDVPQNLDRETDDLSLQQLSDDINLQKASRQGGGKEKASETGYVEEDIKMDLVDKRLDEEVGQFIKEETTSESIGPSSTEGNSMKIIGAIDKGNLDASKFSHEELMSQNQDIIKCVNRVHNDDSEKVTEIFMPEMTKERANNELDVKCLSDIIRDNAEQKQAIFVEKPENTVCSAMNNYKHGGDDINEKEVLTDDGTSEQAVVEQKLQKDGMACVSVPQATEESFDKENLPTKEREVEKATDENEKDGELRKGIQDLNAGQELELISFSDEKLQKNLQFSERETLSSKINLVDDVNEKITITIVSSTIEASTGEVVDKAKVEEVDEHFVLVSNEIPLATIPSPTSACMKEEVVEANERQGRNQDVFYAAPSKEGKTSQQEVENEKLDDDPPQEATEKQNQTITDVGYICKEIFLKNENQNVTVSQAAIEEGLIAVERFDCSPNSQAPPGNSMHESKTSSEVHEEISNFVFDKDDLEIVNERTTKNLNTESVQETIEGCAEQKETTFSEDPVETTSSALKEHDPGAENMAKRKALIGQGTSEKANDEQSLKKDGTNSQEVPYELMSQNSNETSELASSPAQEEIDGKFIQHDEENDELLERSQNLDAELVLERINLPDTYLEKNHQRLEIEPLSKYITSEHKANDESEITSSTLWASIGKKVDKVKQEKFDETVMLVSEEKASETIHGLAGESMKNAVIKSNKKEEEESNQYASYVAPSTEEASSQQGKMEIKFHVVPKAATEEQTQATTDEGYRCKEISLQNEDENGIAHHDFLTENRLKGPNIYGFPVSHASVDDSLQKDKTSCQMHERISNFISDKMELENADHDEAAPDEVTREEGDTDQKNHGYIKHADEMDTPEMENEYKMIKEEMFNAVPEEQGTEADSLNHSGTHESLDQKDIPDQSSHKDYLETVIKNNESSTNESNFSDNLNEEEMINEVLLDQSIPELQSQQYSNIVKEIIEGATELVSEGRDHESCNENCNIGIENDAVKCKNFNELDILDQSVQFEPVVNVKSEQNLKVVEDDSGQSLLSSEPLPIEKNLQNGIEACENSSITDTSQCESSKKSDIKDMTCHEQSVFQAQTGEDMHHIYENSGKPKDDSGEVSKEETSESCVKMRDIKTSNIQRSINKHRRKDTLEDEMASETDSSALHAAQITDQQGEDTENVHKSNLEEQQFDSIITDTSAEEKFAVLLTRIEAYSSCHEDKEVDQELDERNKTVYRGNDCETNYTQVPTQETLQSAADCSVEEAERPETVPEPATLDQSYETYVTCNAGNEKTEIFSEISPIAKGTIEINTRNEGMEGFKQEKTAKLDIEEWNDEMKSMCQESTKQKCDAFPISQERQESLVKASSIDSDNIEEAKFLNHRSTCLLQIYQDSTDEAVVGDGVNFDETYIHLDRESPKITPNTNEEELHDSTGQEREMKGNIWDISVTGGQTPAHADIAEACEPQGASESVSEDKQQETNTRATEIHPLSDGIMEEENFESPSITPQPVEGLVQTANDQKVEEDKTTTSEGHGQEHTCKKENMEDDTCQYEQRIGLSFVPTTGEHKADLDMKEEEMVATFEKMEIELSEDEENTSKNLEQLSKDKDSTAHILQNINSEKPTKIKTTGSSIHVSRETTEKLTESSILEPEGKNPEQMSSIQDMSLVESKKEKNSLLEKMQIEARTDFLKNEGTDSCIHCPTMEKQVEDSNLEIVEIPEDNNSVVQDIPQLEVDKQEDSTKEILQTEDSKNLAKDIKDISSSTHDLVVEVLRDDMKLEDCSIQELGKKIPKETATFEDRSKFEEEKKQDSIAELTHRENIEAQIEKVSTNGIQDSNEETSQEHVGKLVEACGLKLQEGDLEQDASLIDIPQVEARMQDNSFEVQEERTKVFIKDDMDTSSNNHEALRVISQEHVNNPTSSSHLEHQMEIPTGAVCNLQALGDNAHEYASQHNESSKDLEVIQDPIHESTQEEMENSGHPHWEIQKVTLQEPTTAEDMQCLEDEKQEHAAAEVLKESTQNLVKKDTADLCFFSATIASAEDIIQDCKENPSNPSNLKLQEETPEKKPSVEESNQMEIENEKDVTKEAVEMVGETLQGHPDLLQEASNREFRVSPIQDGLQVEEQEEECSAPNMEVHIVLNHDNREQEELQPSFKSSIEEGIIHDEKTKIDSEKHVKSPELESEEGTSETTEISRNIEIEDQPGGEINLSLIQVSTNLSIKTEKTERETQGEVLEADPLGQSCQTTKNNENHDKERLRERFTTENVEEAQNEKREKVEFKGPAADQAQIGQVTYSDRIKSVSGTSLAAKAGEEETTEQVMSKEDSKKHENALNLMSNEQIHILTDAKEHKISKYDQMEALISMTQEEKEEEKVQDSGNKLQKNLDGADLAEEEVQNASGTRKSIDIDCQNEKNPCYTKIMPVRQASIKELLPVEPEERPAGISILVSEEEFDELTGANDDTNIKSNITKDKEYTDLQAEDDELDIQGMKEDITESQRPMTLPEVAIDKQSLDGVGPSFTEETMKAKEGENNVERNLNIKKLTDTLSEEKTAGPSLGKEEHDQDRSKVSNHAELMTMKVEENENLSYSSETTTESGINTDKNKEAVQEVSLPVNEEHTRERIEVSKKIEIQDFQNDEALHISATQLAAKEVVQVETEKELEISNLVTELQHKKENEVNQQGLVQEVAEKMEKEDASGDKKPEEIGQTIVRETKTAQKDLEIVDNVPEQAQEMDVGNTSGEENMKMGEHSMEGKQCTVDDSSDDKPTLCTGLVRSDTSDEEKEEEERKREESGFEAPAEEVPLEMKSMADVEDDSPHYKTETVQTDSVHPEKNAEGPDEEESKQEESGSVAPVLEESSGATDRKPAHKKHNILSSVGSKVKHSIGKVKKAITGKSSHHKPYSPKK